jgi:predicted porin
MKLSRSALGLLSLPLFCGAVAFDAQAQNVTIYGVADLGITYRSNVKTWEEMSYITPRLGFRGREPLSEGYSAEFQLETKLTMDSPVNSAWGDRQAWVGLNGPLGQIRFGYTKDLYDDWADRIDPFGNNGLVGDYTTPVWRAGVVKSRIANDAQWHSPNWNGLRLGVQISLDECIASGCSTGWGARALYAIAGFEILAAYDAPVVTTPNAPQPTAWVVGGSYDFGVVKLSAAYDEGDLKADSRGKDKGTNKGTTVGLEGKLGTGVAKGVWGRLDNNLTGLAVNVFGIGYEYPLSKRTTLYTMMSRDTVVDITGVNGGITHRF